MLGHWLSPNKFDRNRQAIAAMRSTGTANTPDQADAGSVNAGRPYWQERVLVEFSVLSAKVSDLKSFTTDLNATWGGLPIETRQLMLRQLKHMQGYQAALAERIEGFDRDADTTTAEIAADYGLPSNACTCGPGAGCTSCATFTSIVGTEHHLAEQDDENRRLTAVVGNCHPQLEDPTMAISELEIGREFRITIAQDGPIYISVGKDTTPYKEVVEAIHLRRDGSAIHLAIPLDQRVFPLPVVPDEPVAVATAPAEPVKVIVPTVGRKVWFRPGGPVDPAIQVMSPDYDNALGQPLDATIVYVHNDRLVNLLVVDHGGNSFPMHNVQLVQPGDEACQTGHRAEWMPFQVTQAAKA